MAIDRLKTSLTLPFICQPKQLQLLNMMNNSPHLLIGYGGARGGAKSAAVRICAVSRRFTYPGSTALIFRKTYDDLYKNHIMEMQKEWPELYRSCWNEEHKQLSLPQGGTVLFRYADTLKDVMQMKGPGYDDVFVDEASDQTEQELAILGSLNRTTRVDLKARTVFTFNPGGPSHEYLKRIFVDKDLTPAEMDLAPAFIQAYVWDNVFWVKPALMADGMKEEELHQWYNWPQERKLAYLLKNSDYGKKLAALPPDLCKQWLYGLWDDFVGQMFPLRRDVHIVPTFKVPSWWQKFGMNDPGFNDPGVWHCMAVDQDENVYVYREMTFENRSHTYEQQARIVAEATKDDDIPYWVTGGDAMQDLHARTGGPSETIVDYYAKGGLTGFVVGDHAKGCLKRRAAVLHEYLKVEKDGTGKESSRLRIMDCCKRLIATLPAMTADPSDPEQAMPCSIDHWTECAGRGLQFRHAGTVPEKQKYKPGTMGYIDGSNDEEKDEDEVKELTVKSVTVTPAEIEAWKTRANTWMRRD